MHKAIRIGQIVYSTAGRDQGRCFMVITDSSDGYVMLADGDLRKLIAPKRKKQKHLRLTEYEVPQYETILDHRDSTGDALLRKALRMCIDTNNKED